MLMDTWLEYRFTGRYLSGYLLADLHSYFLPEVFLARWKALNLRLTNEFKRQGFLRVSQRQTKFCRQRSTAMTADKCRSAVKEICRTTSYLTLPYSGTQVPDQRAGCSSFCYAQGTMSDRDWECFDYETRFESWAAQPTVGQLADFATNSTSTQRGARRHCSRTGMKKWLAGVWHRHQCGRGHHRFQASPLACSISFSKALAKGQPHRHSLLAVRRLLT